MSSATLPQVEGGSDNSLSFAAIDLRKAANSLCAGYIAGIAGILVGHPLDSMKVHLQTSNSASTVQPPAPVNQTTPVSSNTLISGTRNLSSVAQVTSNIDTKQLNTATERSSLRALYAGVGGPLLTIGLLSSANFALYDTFRRALYRTQQNGNSGVNRDYLHNDSLLNVAISSTAAGGVISFATSPLMVVKTKQQVMLWSMKKAARDTFIHQGGLWNFYSGFGAHFICDAIGRGVYITSYEYLKRFVIARNADCSLHDLNINNEVEHVALLSLKERMLCASLSGILCWSIIYPFDVIRSKIYAKAALLPNKTECPSSSQLAMEVWKKEGYRPFFKGFGVTVARAGPVAATVLPIYDLALDWLSNYPTLRF